MSETKSHPIERTRHMKQLLLAVLLLAPLATLQAYEKEDSLKTAFSNSFSIGAANSTL